MARQESFRGLHKAFEEGRYKQVEYYIKLGVNVNERDSKGRTALMKAAYIPSPRQAKLICRLLLSNGAKTSCADCCGRTALHHAAEFNQATLVAELVQGDYLDVLHQDVDGNTALHVAATHCHAPTLRGLLTAYTKYSLNVDIPNNKGMTALHCACAKRDLEIICILVDTGNANAFQRDNVQFYNALEWWRYGMDLTETKCTNARRRPLSAATSSTQTASKNLLGTIRESLIRSRSAPESSSRSTNVFSLTAGDVQTEPSPKETFHQIPNFLEKELPPRKPSPPETPKPQNKNLKIPRQASLKESKEPIGQYDDENISFLFRRAFPFSPIKAVTKNGHHVRITTTSRSGRNVVLYRPTITSNEIHQSQSSRPVSAPAQIKSLDRSTPSELKSCQKQVHFADDSGVVRTDFTDLQHLFTVYSDVKSSSYRSGAQLIESKRKTRRKRRRQQIKH